MIPIEYVTAWVVVVAVIAYVVLGGADFGAGVWDLLASGERKNVRWNRSGVRAGGSRRHVSSGSTVAASVSSARRIVTTNSLRARSLAARCRYSMLAP